MARQNIDKVITEDLKKEISQIEKAKPSKKGKKLFKRDLRTVTKPGRN